jgi:hypothetical protein
MTADKGRDAVESFLRWAREAIARDPAFRGEVEKALAETTMAPDQRRQVEREIARLADERARAKTGRGREE